MIAQTLDLVKCHGCGTKVGRRDLTAMRWQVDMFDPSVGLCPDCQRAQWEPAREDGAQE